MARFTILIALIALTLFAAHTSARRQQEDEEQSKCERELEDLNLKHCEQHIMQKIQRDEEDEDQDEENFLRMRGIKKQHQHRSPFFRTNYKKKCCNQLRELEENPQCMCEALQQIMENKGEQLQWKQVQKMEKELRNLPQSCGFRSTPRGCDLSSQQN